jgi:hypothetical protein
MKLKENNREISDKKSLLIELNGEINFILETLYLQ